MKNREFVFAVAAQMSLETVVAWDKVKKLADSIGYAREHNRNFLYVSKAC